MGSQRNIQWLGPAALLLSTFTHPLEAMGGGRGAGEGNHDPLEMAQDRSSFFKLSSL